MRRLIFTLTLCLITTQSLFAHFMFVHVIQDDEPRVEIHFSESAWDFSTNQRMIDLIADSRVRLPGAGDVSCQKEPYALVGRLSEGDRVACASFTYGLMTMGESFLLEYHAKGVSGVEAAGKATDLEAEIIATRISPDRMQLTVLFKGRPAPDAEIVVPSEGMSTETMRTDDNGRLEIDLPRTGVFSLRAMIPEEREGVYKDTPYEMVRHYATLTVHADPNAGGDGSDGLAVAILEDAYECSSEHRGDLSPWTGTYDCSFNGAVSRGSLTGTGGSLDVTPLDQGATPPADDLKLLEGLPTPGSLNGGTVRFESDRQASGGTRISIDEDAFIFEVKDRRIESATLPLMLGSRRIDVLEWTETDDRKALPGRMMVTDFDRDGRITRVLDLTRNYADTDTMPVLETLRGKVIEKATESGEMIMKISEVERVGPATGDA